jgi:hypothetical protein
MPEETWRARVPSRELSRATRCDERAVEADEQEAFARSLATGHITDHSRRRSARCTRADRGWGVIDGQPAADRRAACVLLIVGIDGAEQRF